MKRTIIVRDLKMNSISSASMLHVGDSVAITPRARVFAVQREIPFFLENEGGFSNYPMFTQPIPQPTLDSDVQMQICNEDPAIRVCEINIIAVAASSVAQLGNSCRVDAEARTLHIRQLLSGERPVGPPVE